ncbi:cell envelope integrity protein TolA [Massilia sp. TW-1]|uniref:Cell envelope integrity protein TolA n=1 Tax=Telluria antibiotica TaxID=2717319 RepID=A0ABX0PK29_9BURK|nr:cell envelope integrity protein TolA [Telluria antibiotica]NIA57816.1 cell envelope integrity protein TolA [Telluria antibiotica]
MSATKHNNIGNGSPYEVPPEPNRWPAIGLAVGVHALLLAFLWIGISWQNNTPIAVEAEIWDVTTQTAAPAPTPAPEPEPEPETPPPQPAPKAALPPPPVVEQPQPKQPDIALEREKKRKEELKRKQAEEERERELEQKRADDKKAKALAEKKERELEEKKAKAEAEKKEAEKKKKDEAEKKKKEDAEKKKKAAEEQKKLDAARDAEMRRITGAAGNPTSTGKAEKSTAPRSDPGYSAAITAKVKGNTSYAGSLDEPGNPTATFRVEQLPTGEIISVKKIKSSGVPSFDDAVEKGINKSSPLPKKKDGTVERSLVIEFHMKDLQ